MPEISARLLEAIAEGGQVVAATPRLAREIRRNYALHQSKLAQTVWHEPRVRAWDQWLRELGEQVLWSGYSSPTGRRRLLTPLQEQLLWERIIAGSTEPAAPLNVSATATLAREAWTIIQQWRLPDPGKVGFSTAEQQAFSAWMKLYHAECSENAWLDAARVSDSLVPALGSGAVPAPVYVVLVGFEGFNPQQRALLRVITGMGSRLALVRTDKEQGEALRVAFEDPTTELRSAVRWLRGLVAADSGVRAGLVVEDPAQAYDQIERELDDAMLPGHSLPGVADGIAKPYEIAAGRPLLRQPVVVAADHILSMSMGTVSMRVLSRIVRSPFLSGGVAEAARRSRFDNWIRAKGSVDVDVSHLPGMLEAFRHSTGLASEEFGLERQVLSMLDAKPQSGARSPSEWAMSFRALLDLFGWPGDGRLDSVQRQALENFDELLREFGSLDVVRPALAPTEALRLLRQMLRQREFVYETDNAPILVVSPQEAATLRFDQLWIHGSSARIRQAPDEVPNPFIPVEWQQECRLSHSSPELRSAHRAALAAQLLSAAPSVIVSHNERSMAPLHPSYAALPQTMASDIEMAELTDYRQALVASTGIERLDDPLAPPLEPLEALSLDEEVLALQSACPFRAFATKRLDAKAPKPLRPGLLPEARVELVRIALEHLWHRIESSDVLQAALTGEHLEVQIWEVADTVLAVFERKLPVRLSRRYRALEHARLVRLLMQWLRVETQRGAFTVVRTDVHTTVELAGVAYRAHVDRIDQLGSHGLAFIDYDTVPYDPARWLGPRPDAPELLLYALGAEDDPVALLTGCISAAAMNLDGVQRLGSVIDGVPEYPRSELAERTGMAWKELFSSWRDTLTQRSQEFASGDASVVPKYGAATCQNCNLSSFCRVGERLSA